MNTASDSDIKHFADLCVYNNYMCDIRVMMFSIEMLIYELSAQNHNLYYDAIMNSPNVHDK